jgi:hypothetical protein
MTTQELQEIAHTGGKVTFDVQVDGDGRISYSVKWSHSRPTPAGVFAVYALPQGIAVGDIRMAGLGVPWNPPPVPGSYAVLIASDSTGMFGQRCPSCRRYWRCAYGSYCCPYCGEEVAAQYLCLTEGQERYVAEYCRVLNSALESGTAGEHVIDMDAVVDAIGTDYAKPPFYYAEERQQNLFKCSACGATTDVLGTFAYCSACGTRNDADEFAKIATGVRARITAGESPESGAKDIVAAFDSVAAQYAAQLVRRVPLIPARKALVERGPYHNLARVVDGFREAFGFDITAGMSPDDIRFATLMFHRRHVYEHKGGEADEKYIQDSGDNVRVKQALRETQESAHRTVNVVSKLVANLHAGFHQLFPANEEALARHAAARRRS